MGALSIWHVLILAGAALLLFGGRGKISDLMGDVGKGIKSFRTGLSEPEPAPQVTRDSRPPMSEAVPNQAANDHS